MRRAWPELQISISAMEQPPDPRREPHDLAIFYRDGEAAPDTLMAPEADAILPVCAPSLAGNIGSIADLAGQTLLHDAVWRGDWGRWLAFAGGTAGIDPARGPSFSLYSLALDAALSGSGVLMGRASLIGRHLADGRLVAPFALAMPLRDRLTLMLAPAGQAHPKQAEIAAWLLDGPTSQI